MLNPSASFLIPDYIRAKSAKTLRSLMIKNNLKYKQNFKYDVVVKGDYFYAFFYLSGDSFDLINKKEE